MKKSRSAVRGGPEPRPTGLWLLPRKDAGNSGRADVAARMPTAPEEIWHYGHETGAYRHVRRVPDHGWLIQIGRGLELLDPDGRRVWSHRTLGVGAVVDVTDLNGDGRPEALVALGKKGFALLDALNGNRLWTWECAPGAFVVRFQVLKDAHGVRLIVFPASSPTGFCFDFADTRAAPRLLWQREYPGKYEPDYGPALVLADMDRDGKTEIVLAGKPAYAAVLDADTGAIKFDLKYEIAGAPGAGLPHGPGRPYGLLQAVDLDGDGYRDIVMVATQVEEYIAVLRNHAGRALQPVWTRWIEKDFPTDFRQIRASTTSLADVNGDGRPELALGLFNADDDQKWHAVVLDPMRGFTTPVADFPDCYFWDCRDLNGDGISEIIVTPSPSRTLPVAGALRALCATTGAEIASLENARPVTKTSTIYAATRPIRSDITYYGAAEELIPVRLGGTLKGLLVTQDTPVAGEILWRADNGKSICEPFAVTAFARAVLNSTDDWDLATIRADTVAPGVAPARRSRNATGASAPLVCVADGRRELVLALSDGTVIGGQPVPGRPNVLRRAWKIRGTMPSVWLGPAGERIVCVADPVADVVTLHQPVSGRAKKPLPLRIELPLSLNRNASFVDSFPRAATWLMPFGHEQMRLFVSFRMGEHSLACALFDAAGRLLWIDRERGPHPRAAAAADCEDRFEVVFDNHGMQYLYAEDGRRRMIAHCWGDTIPGRADGCAHALPIVGPFGPDGSPRIVMSPGYSAFETLDATGARLACQPLQNHYEFAARVAAVGKPGVAGGWTLGIVSEHGVFHCVDLETCRTRWTLDLGSRTSWSVPVAAAALGGGEADAFIAGLPNGELVAITERDGTGQVLWKKAFDAGVLDVIIADVDGDQAAEIIVETDDGRVRLLKSQHT